MMEQLTSLAVATIVNIHGEEEMEEQTKNALKHRCSTKMKQCMGEGEERSVMPIINNCSIHDDYEFNGVDLSVVPLQKISICFHRAIRIAFCCKSLNKNKTPLNMILNEINVMCRVSGNNGIVKLHGVYEDSQNTHLVLELCSLGDLFKTVMQRGGRYKPDAELEAAMIFKQMMESILYCHAKGVVHRDIKLENIFLTGSLTHPVVKLGDFGLATLFEKGGKLLYDKMGTPAYVAPEILNGQGYTESVDIWSAGVLLYAILSGKFPFEGDNFLEVKRKILKKDVDLKNGVWNKISMLAKDLISRMLVKDPQHRLNATQVLRHPWLNFETCQRKARDSITAEM